MSSATKNPARQRRGRDTSPVCMSSAEVPAQQQKHLPQQLSPLRNSLSALDLVIDVVMDRDSRRKQPAPGCLTKPTQLLIEDLRSVRCPNNECDIDIIIEKARREEFDEYLSHSETPSKDLVAILRANGLHVFADAALTGRYEHD